MWSRRRIIFVGVAGAVAAGAVALLPRWRNAQSAPQGEALVGAHGDMLVAIARGFLTPALPTAPEAQTRELARVVQAIGTLITNLPATTRREIADLFMLLDLAPARSLLGFSGDWPGAGPAAVAEALTALRDSRIAMKQQAYFALHDLVLGSFYSDASTWAATGYPGPPKFA
ncbi:MAG: hypothetical protein JNL19_13840 [Burkholderiales bacterium]|nr:hypothetical protein [Burkholderiales bacterium]